MLYLMNGSSEVIASNLYPKIKKKWKYMERDFIGLNSMCVRENTCKTYLCINYLESKKKIMEIGVSGDS